MSDPAYDAMSKAKRQVESGNPKGAAETLESYLKTDPHNTKPRLLLANIAYFNLNDEGYGDMEMDIILDLEPDNLEALKASLSILSKDKKYRDAAKKRYEKVIELEPSSEIYNAYARFLRNQFLDFKMSAEFYEKAISLSPNKCEYHQNYAVLLLMDLKDFEKAKIELEEVLRIDPGNISARKNYDLLLKKKFDKNGNVKKGLFSRK